MDRFKLNLVCRGQMEVVRDFNYGSESSGKINPRGPRNPRLGIHHDSYEASCKFPRPLFHQKKIAFGFAFFVFLPFNEVHGASIHTHTHTHNLSYLSVRSTIRAGLYVGRIKIASHLLLYS